MKLIVGLGNPGREYEKTRHNIGFMIVDKIAADLGLTFDHKKGGALYTQSITNGEKVILMKPQKYINISGDVIRQFIDYFNINIDDILIISDDLDMKVGTYKLKPKGTSGGHNGLKSIERNLGTTEYKRLKIGISNDKNVDTKDYVLGKFSDEEEKLIAGIIEQAGKIVVDYIKMDFLSLMNKYNGHS